jgi:sec-independent protein translocase protein TatB
MGARPTATESLVFDLNITKLLFLAVIALVVFGPNELPKIAQQAGRALRDLRRIAEGAKADLREGLGPEFQDFDFDDLNPRKFMQKHLLDDVTAAAQPLYDEFKGISAGGTADGTNSGTVGGTTAGAQSPRPTLLDGAEPPYDIEAT